MALALPSVAGAMFRWAWSTSNGRLKCSSLNNLGSSSVTNSVGRPFSVFPLIPTIWIFCQWERASRSSSLACCCLHWEANASYRFSSHSNCLSCDSVMASVDTRSLTSFRPGLKSATTQVSLVKLVLTFLWSIFMAARMSSMVAEQGSQTHQRQSHTHPPARHSGRQSCPPQDNCLAVFFYFSSSQLRWVSHFMHMKCWVNVLCAR